ncbi:MAG: hypothetical protein HY746_07735 [Elusimicrobia bacterium]|nr:hypothetical protein [Elusimicrobiota bacterium]
MKKIKKLKIPIYIHEIARKAKKQKINMEEAGLKDQQALKEFVSTLYSSTEPAVVFDRFPPDSNSGKITSAPGAAFSCGVITLGSAVEDKIKSIKNPALSLTADVSLNVMLNTAVDLVREFISQEAEPDGFNIGQVCHLNPPLSPFDKGGWKGDFAAAEPAVLETLLKKLGSEKIGVKMENQALSPAYTAIFTVPWLPRKKKNK